MREFARREGDPNLGGSASRGGTVTAYRQDADRLRVYLLEHGPTKVPMSRRRPGEVSHQDDGR
ncbi:DUF2161 family putative PD-(D/E)XK-type phosphodiesterase [Ornithinimicrobium sp. INDO-MA30-4]|uniref:DUF2161 family putative PD-(D/E)XK-type phosphodiesterase n=1 Tax=Ornithinimicrobium sp. INDO-MA30-4 TaxID=2908651 RepID=UPI0037C889DF